MDLTRKQFILGAAAAGALAGRVQATPSDAGYTDAILRALPPDDHIWAMERRLAGWCPHFTGSPGHAAYVNMLADELAAAGITPRRQNFRFPYWEPHRWSLSIAGRSVPVTGYRPHSGPTGPNGVEGPLALATDADIKGRIVLIDVVPGPGQPTSGSGVVALYPESEGAAYHPTEISPLGTGMGAARNDQAARAAAGGAAGAVYIWHGIQKRPK